MVQTDPGNHQRVKVLVQLSIYFLNLCKMAGLAASLHMWTELFTFILTIVNI